MRRHVSTFAARIVRSVISADERGSRSKARRPVLNCEGHTLVTIDDVRTTVARSRDGERPDADRCHRHPHVVPAPCPFAPSDLRIDLLLFNRGEEGGGRERKVRDSDLFQKKKKIKQVEQRTGGIKDIRMNNEQGI